MNNAKLIYLFILSFCIPIYSELIVQGLEYNHITSSDTNKLSIHELKVDPNFISIKLEQAVENNFKAKKVTEFVKNSGALAGINGGFYTFGANSKINDILIHASDTIGISSGYSAYPVFCLKINNNWLSLSNKRTGVIAWNNIGDKVAMDVIHNHWRISIGNLLYPIDDINKPNCNGAVLYTSSYGKFIIGKKNTFHLVIQNNKIFKILKNPEKTEIPENGFVYALNNKLALILNIKKININDKVNLVKKFNSDIQVDWCSFDYILGSTPLLIRNGKIQETVLNGQSNFFIKRHPRTAIGLLPDGKWLFVVLEGRIKESKGMTLMELANYFLNKNCAYALNLDGGESSCIVIKGKAINKPCASQWSLYLGKKELRSVGNAFLFFPKAN